MPTLRSSLPLERPEIWAEALQQAVDLLRAGSIVAFPTDTVYGIAADPWNEAALAAIYTAKGRPEGKPLALLVAEVDQVGRLTTEISKEARHLMERFWPGALTLVLPASPDLSPSLLAGRSTLGVRMPDHPVALALLRAFGGPLATTSANLSGEPDLLTAQAVEATLGSRIPLLLDGGNSPGGAPSTVLDLTVRPPRILRPGPLTRDLLSQALDEEVI
jgi:L-threonylcarbamoyladenylate synthase